MKHHRGKMIPIASATHNESAGNAPTDDFKHNRTFRIGRKPMFTSTKTALKAAVAGVLLAGFTMAAQAEVIIQADFTSTGTIQYPAGTSDGAVVTPNHTQLGLTTNLPGGGWIYGAGWHWSVPYIPDTGDVLYLNEEKSVLGLTLASSGGYTKPTTLTISADLAQHEIRKNSSALLGFWSALDGQNDSNGSTTDFTGLALTNAGNLQLYVNGAASGSPIATGLPTTPYTYEPGTEYEVTHDVITTAAILISYDVDLTSGDISNIFIDGNPMSDITTTAFTDAATAFAGFASGGGSRVYGDNFLVTTEIPEPAALGLLAAGGLVMLGRKRRRV